MFILFSVSLLFHPKMPCTHQNVGAESHTKQPFSQRRRVTMEYYKMKGQMNSCIVAGTLGPYLVGEFFWKMVP